MPRIPDAPVGTIDARVRGTDVPRGGGEIEMEMAKIGGKVSEFAQDILEKRKKAQDNDYAFSSYANDYTALQEYENDLKLKGPEDGEGFQQSIQDFTKKRMDEGFKNAPSEDAKDLYHRRSEQLFMQANVEASNYENTQKAKFWASNIDRKTNQLSSSLLANPSATQAAEIQRQVKDEIAQNVGIHFDEKTGQDIAKTQSVTIGKAVLDGLDSQERYQEGIAYLKDQKGKGAFLNDMDSETRGMYLRRFENAAQTKQHEHDTETRLRVSDMANAYLDGNNISPKEYASLVSDVNKSGYKPDEKARILDTLQIANVVGGEMKNLAITPRSQWKNPESLIEERGSGWNSQKRDMAISAMQHQMRSIISQQDKDPVQFMISNRPNIAQLRQASNPNDPAEMKNYFDTLISQQTALGIPSPRLLTNVEAQSMSEAIKVQGVDSAMSAILNVKNSYGQYASKAMQEIVKKGNLDDDYMLLVHVPNSPSMRSMVENIKNKDQINDAFKKNRPAISANDIQKQVAIDSDKYVAPLLRGKGSDLSRTPFANAINEQVQVETKKILSMSSGNSIADASKEATRRVLDQNYITINEASSNILVPRMSANGSENNEGTIRDFVKAHSTADGLKDLGVRIDKTFKDSYIAPPAAKASSHPFGYRTMEDAYYTQLADQAYWDLSEDGTGLNLVVNAPKGKKVLANSDNKPVFVPFNKMLYDQRTVDQGRNFFQKVGSVLSQGKAEARGKK